MQRELENSMKATRHQVHGMRRGEGKAVMVLHVGGEQNAPVMKTLARPSKAVGQFERDGGNRLVVPRLASFAGANRTQLAVLSEAGVTDGLREVVTGVTYLASVRPMSPRLAVAPIVLVREQDFSPGRTARGELMEPARSHDLDLGVDVGGIYSW
ncbi:hypothetical protein [Archangium lansingense]|uniref:Uncharacterized protein n=1 Tax=Archangium lansingense TaxID=2995310 RepID=A0ABT3ZY70_9BACT|nr:hypothetical protein [Archangium lansinium]MCY1073704.1 hypothetical protein [Archangium lansinium]